MSNQSKALLVNTFNLSMKGSLASLLIALIALSFAAIFIKLSEQEISAISTVFNRLWIAAILLGGWNWSNQLVASSNNGFENDTSNLERFPKTREIVLLLLVGIIGTASVLCWAWSLTQTSVANSTLMRNLSPLFTCIMGWLFFQQRFEARFIGSMLLAILGASVIGIQDLQIGLQHLLGDGLGLLAALFYSLNLLILEYLRPKFSAVTLLFWRCTVGAIVLLPLIWLTKDTFFPHSWQGWTIIFALAIVCQCFGQCMLIHNLKYFSSSFIAIFLLLEPTLTAIFAWLIFAETLSPLNSLGFVIVLLGIFLARTSQKSDQKTLMEEKTA
ncbi:MAG: DMT family transporter [Moorea sp. SIOASIH]|uniref:DMT family transporter n=1 Tax=Moorena sp. SIOASIH TaxID=2607817 RepID=UPI0013B97C57|nr:DMT family transporter [Moorena sp. SIOASIH]NEO40898.1 DMT family transporter [Moorena sp. SIOASIH]